MTKQEAAQAYLRRDPVLYANLLEALRRGSAELLEAGEAAGNGLGGLRPFRGP